MLGRRPIATSSWSPRAGPPRSSSTSTSPSLARTATAFTPQCTSTPASRSASSTCRPAKGSSRGIRPVGAFDQRHLHPERAVGLSHLHTHHSATEDHKPLGQLLGRCHLAVGPVGRLAQAVDGRHERVAARGHNHRAAGHQRLVAGLDAALAGQAAALAHHGHAAALEPGHHPGVVEVVDDLVAALEHRGHVELAGHGLAHAGDAAHLGKQLAGAQQRLRRHAGVEGALTPDQVRLDDRHIEAGLAQAPGADLAGRAGADDDHIELSLAHRRHGTGRPAQRYSAQPDISGGPGARAPGWLQREVGSVTVYFSAAARLACAPWPPPTRCSSPITPAAASTSSSARSTTSCASRSGRS